MRIEDEQLRSNGDPRERIAGHQRWRDMLLLHWSAPAARIRALVPDGLELDTFGGRAWVSILTFRAERTRARGMPAAWGFDFLELNLRTYVRHQGTRGIYFFAIDASSPIAVAGARALVGLPYRVASQRIESAPDGVGRFQSTSGPRRFDARYRRGALRGEAAPGTLEHFLVERYSLFTRRGPLFEEVRVTHHPYALRDVTLASCEQTLTHRAGIEGPPELAHICDRLDVALRGPWLHRAPARREGRARHAPA